MPARLTACRRFMTTQESSIPEGLLSCVRSACAEHRIIATLDGVTYLRPRPGLVIDPGFEFVDCSSERPLSEVLAKAPPPLYHVLPERSPCRRSPIRSIDTREAVETVLYALNIQPSRQLMWALVALASESGWPSAFAAAPAIRLWLIPKSWAIMRAAALEQRLTKAQANKVIACGDPQAVADILSRTRSLSALIDKKRKPLHHPEGTLYFLSPPLQRAGLLEVTCPSTGARHILCVPVDGPDVSVPSVRRWTFHGLSPDIET